MLAEGDAIGAGVQLEVSTRFNGEAAPKAEPAGSVRIYLPLVSQGDESVAAANAPDAGTAITATLPTMRDGGIDFYHLWHMQASAPGGGVTNELTATQEITHLAAAVTLIVATGWLEEAGVAPTSLRLWARALESEEWQPLASEYDGQRHALVAQVTQFGDFGLAAAGLEKGDELLPSVKGFQSDRFSGAATVNYPIATPAGLGGMRPEVGLSYSSLTIDELVRNIGDERYTVQAGLAGLGWSLSGVSYIQGVARPDISDFYALVLNGMHLNIYNGTGKDNQQPRLDPEIFASVTYSHSEGSAYYGWDVTTADGVRYRFGGEKAPQKWPVEQTTRSGYVTSLLQNHNGETRRRPDKFYLREVTDPLGNRIEYSYLLERGSVNEGCVRGDEDENHDFDEADEYHYDRAVLPEQIVWSGNDSEGVTPKLRVRYVYADRTDTDLWPNGDCWQALSSTQRLSSIVVEVVAESGAWSTLSEDVLEHGYYTATLSFPGDPGDPSEDDEDRDVSQLLLMAVRHYGLGGEAGGALLNRQSYEYQPLVGTEVEGEGEGELAQTANNVRLVQVNNGFGGEWRVKYTRTALQIPPDEGPSTDGNAYPVTQMLLDDGMGNRQRSEIALGAPLVHEEHGNFDGHPRKIYEEFLGFSSSSVTSYEMAPLAEQATAAEVRVERIFFHQLRPNEGVDARVGKPKVQEVWSPPLAQCQSYQERDGEGRCLLARTSNEWQALVLQAGEWTPREQWPQEPVWVRQERVSEWVDGAENVREYHYAVEQQGGGQFGNVSELREYERVNGSATLLRRTTRDYFPNQSKNIVNLPGRERVYGADGMCKSEVRTVYSDFAAAEHNQGGDYAFAPQSNLVAKREQALNICWDGLHIGKYDTAWQTTRFDYDRLGNQIARVELGSDQSGGQDDVTLTGYDAFYRLFAVREWKEKAPAFETSARYYGVNATASGTASNLWGALAEECGVNGVCTRHSYDAFGRPLRRWEAVVQGSAWETDAEAETAWIYLSPGEPAAGGLAAVQSYVVVEWRNPRCLGNFERRHYNGLGQLVRQQRPQQEWTLTVEGCTPGQSGGEVDIDSAYNALGLPSRVSTPTGNDYTTWPTRRSDWPPGGYTQTSYDALGRVTQVVAPNGESSRHFYGGRESSLVLFGRNGDGNKLAQWQVTDGLGNLRHVRSYTPNGAGWLLEGQVTLTHDELGNLRQVTHPTGAPSTGSGQAITTLSYGLGGRKTSINDPDLGAWSYGYDRQGRPTRQTDARGKTTCLYYDVLGRLVGKDFNQSSGGNCAASASMEVSYSYDTGHGETQRSRGQLTQVAYSDLSYRQELGYDAFGRLVSQAVSIADAGQPFISETYYDAYQRTVGLASPDGEVVKTSYNSMGLPRQLCEASWQSTTGELACLDGQPALVDNAHYDAAGRLTSMELSAGGGLWREQEYYPWSSSDGNSNGRLAEVRLGTVAGGNDLLRLHYSYDSFGNVSELQERYGSEAQQSQRFCYDAQNRLVRGYAPASAAFDCASATAGQRYSYDAAGRLTNYEGTAFTAGALRAHLSLPGGAFAGLAYAVDGNGNLTKRGDAQLVWDHENRLVMFSRSGTIGYPGPPVASGATSELTPEPIEGGGTVSTWSEKESYLYDADGVRVKKVAPNGAATYTPFPHYEVSDGVVTKYYFFAGQRIAMKRNGVLTYLHSDHLGSIVATTNISGALTSSRGYRAYGNYRRGGDLPTDYRFTGQKQDASGLVYMNARYYDPVLGQFISPDTLVPDAGNVQDYNRYGYTRGNPMKFNDPSGHYSNDEIMQHYGCGDWGCVEAQFGDGGSHAGLWGWLYILQQAVDGDSVASFNYSGADGIAGTINSALQGVFQRDGNGQINVRATGWSTSGGGESNQQAMSAVVPEVGFAAFAGNANVFGSYGLVGAAGVFATNAHHKHNYLSVDPGQAAIAGLKAGADFGPLIIAAAPAAGPAAPIVASVGVGYTVIGASVSLVVDVALPVAQAFMGNTRPAWESIGVETVSQSSRYFGRIGEQVAPFVGPVYDLGKAICYGTGCSR